MQVTTLIFRCKIDRDIPTEKFRLAIGIGIFFKSFGNFFHKLKCHILMRHFSAAQSQSDLQAELLIEEVDRLIEFRIVIMLIDIDMKLYFFDLLSSGVLALRFEILFLLIAQLAEVHDSDNRRI